VGSSFVLGIYVTSVVILVSVLSWLKWLWSGLSSSFVAFVSCRCASCFVICLGGFDIVMWVFSFEVLYIVLSLVVRCLLGLIVR